MKSTNRKYTVKRAKTTSGHQSHLGANGTSMQVKPTPCRPKNLDAVVERSSGDELAISEKARTDRLRLSLCALCSLSFLAGCIVVVLAPAGGESAANWIGAAIVIATAGVTGHTHVWGHTKLISVGAQSESVTR